MSNIRMRLSESRKNDIRAEIANARRLIEKEQKYSEDLQHKEYIEAYTKAIAQLEKYLEQGYIEL